jgi:hypothetical protein
MWPTFLRISLLVAWVALATACGDSVEPTTLLSTTNEPPGANCQYGGTAIHAGLDGNDNGALDADEISSTSYVCSPVPLEQQLVRVSTEPAGANCAYGGQAIATGLDADHDGTLGDDEVIAISYVCAGPPGTQTLVTVVSEPAGAHCTYGGQAIETGADLDHDGTLDANEVAATSYVCASSSGEQALIRVESEPPGANCTAGGTAIEVGLDLDANGSLGTSEIQSTSYLCGAPPQSTVIDGDVIIRNSHDLAMLDGVSEVTGDIVVQMSTLTNLELPALQHVGGRIDCTRWDESSTVQRQCQLVSLRLPALESASLAIWAPLATLELPNLASSSRIELRDLELTSLALDHLAHSTIYIDSLHLTSLSLPALVSGPVQVDRAPLTALDLPVLASGGVQIRGVLLEGLSLPNLVSGVVEIENTPALTSISAPTLATAEHISVYNVPLLAELSLPMLQTVDMPGVGGEDLYLVNNAGLQSVVLPMLSSAERVMISNNPALPTCAAQAIANQAAATSVVIAGNNDGATCQ